MKNRVHAARHFRFALPLIVLIASASVASATMVEYTGQVTVGGQPAENTFVIAGTFDPAFEPSSYKFVYGVDEAGNMGSTQYSQAIADGNFRPIGNGTHTSASGFFNGSGTASEISGSPIYLFVLSDQDRPGPSDPDLATLFALATSSSWFADDINVIDGSEADSFVFGQLDGSAIELQGLPFPEPASGVLMISGILLALPMFRRRRFRGCATKA